MDEPLRVQRTWSEALPTDHRRFIAAECLLAGEWQGSAATFEVNDPATGHLVGHAASIAPQQLTPAIDAAQDALAEWSGLLPQQRASLLHRWCDLILENRESLAALVTHEQGKPLSEALGEIDYGASFVRWYAEEARRVAGEAIDSHIFDRRMTVRRDPVGIVAAITPWNFPSAMMARKASAALAAGCTVIGVPSAMTPFSALALARLADEAGFPGAVFSVITGDARVLVPVLCADERVRAVSFTGSTQVGRIIAGLGAPTIKRLSLELGGHAPFIVFDDADLDAAVAGAVEAKFQTSGQDCLAANRVFVHHHIYPEFVERFVEATARLKVGSGFEPGVQIGPLIGKAALEKVDAQVRDAIAKGARLCLGGGVHDAGPLFYQPTVLADVTPEMLIMQEETFGPVAAICTFSDEDDVVRRANATEYGLAAYLFTKDLARSERVSRGLEFGMVGINTATITGAPIPFGGVKQSGLGREGSRHGLEEFTELKYVCAAY